MTAPQRTPGTSVNVARPIFQVLRDNAATCMCHVWTAPHSICSQDAMDVPATEYTRPDRRWL